MRLGFLWPLGLISLSGKSLGASPSGRVLAPQAYRCDSLSWPAWRQHRVRFRLYVEDRLQGPSLFAFVENASAIAASSISRLAAGFATVFEHLRRISVKPPEPCVFGEVAALQVLYLALGTSPAGLEGTLANLDCFRYLMQESGWPVLRFSILTGRNRVSPLLGPSYEDAFSMEPAHLPLRSNSSGTVLKAVLVGSHASQLVQTGRMLAAATGVLLFYAGCFYPSGTCRLLGDDPGSRLSRAISVEKDAEEVRRAILAGNVLHHDLVIAFGPILGSLVRELSEDVLLLNILGTYPFVQLSRSIPLGMAIKEELEAENPKTFTFATSAVCSLQLFYMTGLRVPVITPLPNPPNLYAPSIRALRSLLQWRADIVWNTKAGAILSAWILKILQENKVQWNMLSMSMGPEASVRGISWEDISSHDAILFFPEDLTKIAFWDLYAAGMPLFVAEPSLVAQIICPEPTARAKMHFFDPVAQMPSVVTGIDEALEPFDLSKHCADKLEHWMPFADFYNFPHLLPFSSTIELVEKLLEFSASDLQRVSTKMTQAAQKKREAARIRFTHALAHLFPGNRSRIQ